jgi:exonuclease III
MINFLFWNVQGKPLQNLIAALAHEHQIDVVMLVECGMAVVESIPHLLQGYHHAPGGCEKVEIFSRLPQKSITKHWDEDRLTIRRLALANAVDILLAVTHFPSKLHTDNDSQAFGSTELSRSIRLAEEKTGHSRTILVGDLNMHPFEIGMVSANGLHGVMSQKVAQKGTRTVSGKQYPFFYNPMWNLLGDKTPGPPGTYYKNTAQLVNYFWSMFDQVLVRPDLLRYFKHESLTILGMAGPKALLTRDGTSIKRGASDHLPIMFSLDL